MLLADPVATATGGGALPDDAFVMLDPAVELLDVTIAGCRLLAHGHFETGMTLPPGDALLDLLADLGGLPVKVGLLRDAYSDPRLANEMLQSLHNAGFLHVTAREMPGDDMLIDLRQSAARRRAPTLRPIVSIDLDTGIAANDLCSAIIDSARAPELVLRGTALHAHAAILSALAERRQSGAVRINRIEIRTRNAACDDALSHTLHRLEAAVVIEGVAWPAPKDPIPGLADLTRHCIAVQAQMTPDQSIGDAHARDRAIDWVSATFVSGLRLRLETATAADVTDAEIDALLDAVDALEDSLGDVLVENLPSDEVILGRVAGARRAEAPSDGATRLRQAYLRRRIPFLKACEGENSWSQTPEAEEKLVRPEDDLLPNNPDLLLLRNGSTLIDICGGLGRVARRLAPAVGPDGAIISLEMYRCISDRARQIACDRRFTNLHFRPGLAQRIPLPDGVADAAVNEWTGAIWELGLGPAMIGEMRRVVRPGGRIAVTHRLVRLPLARLGEPWVQYEEIYGWVRAAFNRPDLTILGERVWGQVAPSMIGEHASWWRKQYLPCAVDQHDFVYEHEAQEGVHADVYLTIIAEVRGE